ncbi:MAG: hypothetical protein WDA05_04100 [Candidatus Methanomethylophilaceae archaeon]|nr:hypothetical protein [Candidatus Methanomethylophilaceae archaeon]MDI9378221.1 hypothetical protein [Candidatus Thermoplasmatota archaeon]MDD2778868.1 hypothetical protein [Candidatus Methanomethylophilaceae archaeon]MDD3128261.1 hypothetical protein [Candidatus Methanomethylophilaceae archaeon]MDD4119715.1 hypothetical protein [Candidatus Methanomethylophilaceae archaeon]
MESKGKFILGIIVLVLGFAILTACSSHAVHDAIWSAINGG